MLSCGGGSSTVDAVVCRQTRRNDDGLIHCHAVTASSNCRRGTRSGYSSHLCRCLGPKRGASRKRKACHVPLAFSPAEWPRAHDDIETITASHSTNRGHQRQPRAPDQRKSPGSASSQSRTTMMQLWPPASSMMPCFPQLGRLMFVEYRGNAVTLNAPIWYAYTSSNDYLLDRLNGVVRDTVGHKQTGTRFQRGIGSHRRLPCALCRPTMDMGADATVSPSAGTMVETAALPAEKSARKGGCT